VRQSACQKAETYLTFHYPSDYCKGVPILAGPANAPALRCDCWTTILLGDSDHPLTCTCLALQRTSRHEIVTTSWRRIAAGAGVHTTAELLFRFFPTCSSPPAVPSAGPMLASSLGGCASGLLVLVPDAPALAPAAAPALPDDPAPSPGSDAPFRSLDPLGVPPLLGPGARGIVMFVFLRRLVVVDVSVIHPAATSFARGTARNARFAAAAQDTSNAVRIGRCPPPCPLPGQRIPVSVGRVRRDASRWPDPDAWPCPALD
jgi:hypothetical protein